MLIFKRSLVVIALLTFLPIAAAARFPRGGGSGFNGGRIANQYEN